MAERLAVDGDELAHFMKMLRKSTDSLKGLRKALEDATVTGLGTDDLDTACEDFQDDYLGKVPMIAASLLLTVSTSLAPFTAATVEFFESIAKSLY